MLASVVAVLALAFAASAHAAPATVVSLTFDDGNADQINALPALQQYGLRGTFYIISGVVGAPNYVTENNLRTIAADGHEIGGHTVSHPDLTTVPLDEAQRQICNDRVNLSTLGSRLGFGTPTSFAYPYASHNQAVEGVARQCGYNSARTLGDITSAHSDPAVTDVSGPIPPVDAYNLPAPDQIDNTWTLAQMQSVVTDAEQIGGWVIFTFHHVCPGASTACDSLSVSQTVFASFLSWLKTRPATTSVKTIGQVIGGPVTPAVPGRPPTATTSLANPSLELAASGDVFPTCWMPGSWGTNTPTWTRTSDAYNGSFAENLVVAGYSSGDAKLLPTFDLGSCSPAVTPGTTYTVGTFYKSTGTTQFALYYRDSAGGWYYWTSSPWFAPAASYTQATFTTPPVPAAATGMSFGLALVSNGSLTTDQYSLVPASGATATMKTLAASSVVSEAASGAIAPNAAPSRQAPALKTKRARRWGKHAKPFVPGESKVRPGTKVAPPFRGQPPRGA